MVQQITGASAFTDESPVSRPTFSGPSCSHRSKNFSDTSAFTGAVYQERPPPATDRAWAASATSDFPDPVGVARMTFDPDSSSRIASSWCGYSSRPRSMAQSVNPSMMASASGSPPVGAGRKSTRRRATGPVCRYGRRDVPAG